MKATVAQVMLGGFFVGRLSSRGFRAGSLLAGVCGGDDAPLWGIIHVKDRREEVRRCKGC